MFPAVQHPSPRGPNCFLKNFIFIPAYMNILINFFESIIFLYLNFTWFTVELHIKPGEKGEKLQNTGQFYSYIDF